MIPHQMVNLPKSSPTLKPTGGRYIFLDPHFLSNHLVVNLPSFTFIPFACNSSPAPSFTFKPANGHLVIQKALGVLFLSTAQGHLRGCKSSSYTLKVEGGKSSSIDLVVNLPSLTLKALCGRSPSYTVKALCGLPSLTLKT